MLSPAIPLVLRERRAATGGLPNNSGNRCLPYKMPNMPSERIQKGEQRGFRGRTQ
jgi:hypothetical protein